MVDHIKTTIKYKYICLDDFSRVKLREIPGEEGSDYINASFLDVSHRTIYMYFVTINTLCYSDLFRDIREQTLILELKVPSI